MPTTAMYERFFFCVSCVNSTSVVESCSILAVSRAFFMAPRVATFVRDATAIFRQTDGSSLLVRVQSAPTPRNALFCSCVFVCFAQFSVRRTLWGFVETDQGTFKDENQGERGRVPLEVSQPSQPTPASNSTPLSHDGDRDNAFACRFRFAFGPTLSRFPI